MLKEDKEETTVVMVDEDEEWYVLPIHSTQALGLFTAKAGEHPVIEQPHLTTPGKKWHWVFKDEIHDWFCEQDLPYELAGYRLNDYDYMYQLAVDNENVAMRFKLAWINA